MTSMNVCNVTDELFLESIIGFHSFAGCDTVSTFSRWGKAKPLKLMTKSFHYIEAFSMFGKEITLADSQVNKLEMFVCHMYGWKENDVDNVRYHCTARVVEKSPVIHYSLLMMFYTSQGQTTRLTFVGKIWWHNRNTIVTIVMVRCTMAKKLFDP